jgi:transposase-like protein
MKGWGGIMSQGPNLQGREALALFADELSALHYLEGLLWPTGVRCPHCGPAGKVGKLNGETTRLGTHKCYVCRRHFSVLHGTLMSASHVPAHKWLQAIYLTQGGTKPMRPYHLHRILNVSFKTAASMMRRIGQAAAQLHYPTSQPEPPPAVPPSPALQANVVAARGIPAQVAAL